MGSCLDAHSPDSVRIACANPPPPPTPSSNVLVTVVRFDSRFAGIVSPQGMHTAGWDAARGQCAALGYAGGLPISHPLLSPAHAGPDLLGGGGAGAWPPTLLIVGGSEILMPETLEFATSAQAAGAPVVARVYAGMFHDFQQYSQGCGGPEEIAAGQAAMDAAAAFMLRPPRFSKLESCAGCDYAPVAWVSNHTKRPPIAVEQCNY